MRGAFVHFTLTDVGSELDMARVPLLLGQVPQRAALVTRSALPRYAGFRQPLEVRVPADGWGAAPPGAEVEVRVHDLGVVAVRIRVPLELPELAALPRTAFPLTIGGRSLDEVAQLVYAEVQEALQDARIEPYDIFVEPEPYLVYVFSDPGADAAPVLKANRALIAALIEGEKDPTTLAPSTVERALRNTVQYLSDDAVVIGWERALIIAPDGQYEDVLDVIELANMERLELRTYDAYLDKRLDDAFATLDGLWSRGGLFRSARHTMQDIAELRIEFARLTDNLYDTHKLFGDWYVATIHSALTQRFHLDDWRGAVDAKMETLKDLFASAGEEVNHRRALLLEAMIVLLFIVDLTAIFVMK